MIRLIVFIFSFLFSNVGSDQIIAKVGDKIISVQDFIERAEYTPRPFYCRGKSSIDKRIILNSLIGEKLFSIEMTKEVPIEIDNYLVGRRNQKMREVLFESITQDSFKKKNKFSHWKSLSSLEYSFSYLSILSDYQLNELQNEISIGKSLDEIFYLKTNSTNIPKRENVNLFTVGNRSLREILFSKIWNSGDIIGPIKTDDNLIMFVQIDSRHKIINMNQSAMLQVDEEIDNLIVTHLQESDFDIYVKDVMSGLTFELNPNTYLGFANSIKEWYVKASDIKNNDGKSFLNIENPDDVLLTLNDEEIYIGEVLDWMAVHPLVFRDGYYKELYFSDQLKYALADLIKDRSLNIESFKRNLDQDPDVLSEYEKWYDNYRAISHRKEIIEDEKEFNSSKVTKELNEYFIDLTKKYSQEIRINLDALEQITLSSIDMATYNKIGPYKLAVPLFPIITNTYKLNYGQPLNM